MEKYGHLLPFDFLDSISLLYYIDNNVGSVYNPELNVDSKYGWNDNINIYHFARNLLYHRLMKETDHYDERHIQDVKEEAIRYWKKLSHACRYKIQFNNLRSFAFDKNDTQEKRWDDQAKILEHIQKVRAEESTKYYKCAGEYLEHCKKNGIKPASGSGDTWANEERAVLEFMENALNDSVPQLVQCDLVSPLVEN